MNSTGKKPLICRWKSFAKNTKLWLLLLPAVFSVFITYWNPVIKGVYMSFFSTKGYKIGEFVGLQNYINVLNDTMFLQTLLNTLTYVFYSLTIGFLLPFIIAIAINEMVHFKNGFKTLVYLPAIAPALAVSVIWLNMYSPTASGFFNVILGWFGMDPQIWLLNENWTILLIVVSTTWVGYGGTVLLYLAALQTVRQDLYEACILDGGGVWSKFFHITLPHVAPTMVLIFVKQIIGVFQIMHEPLVMTDGGPNNASLSLNLTSYKLAFSYMQVDRALALGVVSFIMLLVITLIYFKLDKKFSE